MTIDVMEFNKLFAKRLRYYMEVYGYSQKDLADKLKVSTTSVYNWYHGIKCPRMDKVDALCKIFHCTRDDLITDPKDQVFKNAHTASDNMESAPEGYYTDPETAKIAQEIFDDENLRTLFHVARNASPEQLKLAKEMLEMMKRNEENR